MEPIGWVKMQTPWLQNYDPLHQAFWLTVAAGLPVAVLLGSIALLRIRIHLAALLGLGVALAMALWVLLHAREGRRRRRRSTGRRSGCFPMGWLILNIIFLYQLTVKRGCFEVLRRQPGRAGARPADPGDPDRLFASARSSRAWRDLARRWPSPARS